MRAKPNRSREFSGERADASVLKERVFSCRGYSCGANLLMARQRRRSTSSRGSPLTRGLFYTVVRKFARKKSIVCNLPMDQIRMGCKRSRTCLFFKWTIIGSGKAIINVFGFFRDPSKWTSPSFTAARESHISRGWRVAPL